MCDIASVVWVGHTFIVYLENCLTVLFYNIARVKRVCKNGFKNSSNNTSYIVCANHNKNILES
jgi:adenosine/AMP kinase